MNQIKESSTPSSDRQPINSNSFGRINKTFAHFIIDFLAVQLVFNNWFPFKCQNAPSPYVRNIEPKAKMDAIQMNQKILILLVLHMNPRAHSLLLVQGRSGWPSPNLKKFFFLLPKTTRSSLTRGSFLCGRAIILTSSRYVCLCVYFHISLLTYCLTLAIQEMFVDPPIGWYYNLFTPIFMFQLAWTLPPIQNITSSMVIGISLFVLFPFGEKHIAP
jgi:hypothetical protein